ncbi:THAP domain-containing protein 4 [Harpegnathos saltator]|uniref:THAP domain-containing protein 4 n=1 Tax=Harpegnathos saltator TaxID=610380 RepID=E2B9K9_HARSA|nr:THAP domain-containing protein 4 [Harpegnathos saltator]
MTGCCIPGCRNRSENGFYMKRFPISKKQKIIWLKQIGRENWKPKQYSAICEVHFTKEMWEKPRQDGSKKLKTQAVPTSFPYTKVMSESFDGKIKKLKYNKNNDENNEEPTSIVFNCSQVVSNVDEEHPAIENNSCPPFIDNVEVYDQMIHGNTHLLSLSENNVNNENTNVPATTSSSIFNVTSSTLEYALEQITLLHQKLEHKETEVKQMKQQLEIANKVLKKCDKTRETLMNCIRRYRSTNKLRVENTLSQSTQLFQKVFNNDQIEWLKSNSSNRRMYKWSKKTIKEALRIKFSCTNSGYQELINQKIPLPSTRTLRRSLYPRNNR